MLLKIIYLSIVYWKVIQLHSIEAISHCSRMRILPLNSLQNSSSTSLLASPAPRHYYHKFAYPLYALLSHSIVANCNLHVTECRANSLHLHLNSLWRRSFLFLTIAGVCELSIFVNPFCGYFVYLTVFHVRHHRHFSPHRFPLLRAQRFSHFFPCL